MSYLELSTETGYTGLRVWLGQGVQGMFTEFREECFWEVVIGKMGEVE